MILSETYTTFKETNRVSVEGERGLRITEREVGRNGWWFHVAQETKTPQTTFVNLF